MTFEVKNKYTNGGIECVRIGEEFKDADICVFCGTEVHFFEDGTVDRIFDGEITESSSQYVICGVELSPTKGIELCDGYEKGFINYGRLGSNIGGLSNWCCINLNAKRQLEGMQFLLKQRQEYENITQTNKFLSQTTQQFRNF